MSTGLMKSLKLMVGKTAKSVFFIECLFSLTFNLLIWKLDNNILDRIIKNVEHCTKIKFSI